MTEALAAAVEAARAAGLPADDPEVLHEGANVVVHLRPAPVVARVTVSLARGVAALETELAFARLAAERGAPVVPPARDEVHGRVTFWSFVEGRRVAHRRTEHAAVAEGRPGHRLAELDVLRVAVGVRRLVVEYERFDHGQGQ